MSNGRRKLRKLAQVGELAKRLWPPATPFLATPLMDNTTAVALWWLRRQQTHGGRHSVDE